MADPAMSDSSDMNQRRVPEEKGPFGKSTRRRGMSRSKTVTPARKEDQARIDNIKVIDDIFASYKHQLQAEESARARKTPLNTGNISAPPAPLENTTTGGPVLSSQPTTTKEPTEVLLYGFGSDVQWAAIEFYERISQGTIYEDYDRHPPNSKYNLSLSLSRAAAQRSLSQAALRKKNQYVGGDHWIKVTFDSPEAADLACYYSPHNIQNYVVYAERYRGTGPKADVAIPVNKNGASSLTSSPIPTSSTTLHDNGSGTYAVPSETSSATASSATATVSAPASIRLSQPANVSSSSGSTTLGASSTATSTGAQPGPVKQAPLRIRGAKRAELLPAEMALLPVTPRWQQTFSNLPLVGMLFGGGSEIIGNQVPRKEDGSFDWDNASFYWKLWALVDYYLGTNLCGIRGDD